MSTKKTYSYQSQRVISLLISLICSGVTLMAKQLWQATLPMQGTIFNFVLIWPTAQVQQHVSRSLLSPLLSLRLYTDQSCAAAKLYVTYFVAFTLAEILEQQKL